MLSTGDYLLFLHSEISPSGNKFSLLEEIKSVTSFKIEFNRKMANPFSINLIKFTEDQKRRCRHVERCRQFTIPARKDFVNNVLRLRREKKF